MRIKLLEDCEKGEKGSVVNMSKLFANSLIKKGLAEEVKKTYRLRDLCFAELAYVEDRELQNVKYDEVSDIKLWIKPVNIGIFNYHPPKFIKCAYIEGDYYQLVNGRKKIKANNSFNNHKIKEGDYIVNRATVKDMSSIMDDLKLHGWDLDSELTKYEIYDFEKYLSKKYCLYKDMSLYI